MEQLNFLKISSTWAPLNLALEETLMESPAVGDRGLLLLWRNRPSVIIGRHQNAYAEVNLAELRRRGVDLVRRPTGGGAVYHDLGNLNISFILPRERKIYSAELLRPLIDYLASLGVEAVMSGRNDITVGGGGKFAGLAGRESAGRRLLHGSILYSADLGALTELLRVDPEKYLSKGVASARARVSNLGDFLPMSLAEFQAGLLAAYDPLHIAWPKEVLAKAEDRVRQRYGTEEWNLGQSPPADISLKRRFAFGSLELSLGVRQGRVEKASLAGDFLTPVNTDDTIPASRLAQALIGLPADDQAAWAEAWSQFDFSLIFHGRTDRDELLNWVAGQA